MKKGIIYKCMIGLGICLALGCGIYYYKAPKAERLDLKTMIRDLNSERQAAIEEPIQYKLADFQKELEPNDFTEEELELLFTKGEAKPVTKEEAIEDIHVLFKVLSQSYGGYFYFGGKERFDKAEQEMISQIENLAGGVVSRYAFAQIFGEGLAFIEDSHLDISNMPTAFKEQYCYYGSGIDKIEKDTNGYYLLEEGKKYYIEEKFEAYIQPTIGEEGQLVYGLFDIVNEEEKQTLPTSMTLNRGKESIQKEITWELCEAGSPSLEEGRTNYSYKEVSGIPVVTYRQMDYSDESLAFIEDGIKLRDREVAVLDLRENTGGLLINDFIWLYQITGKIICPKVVQVDYDSQIGSYATKVGTEYLSKTGAEKNLRESYPDFYKAYSAYAEDKKYVEEETKWCTTHYNEGTQWTENETLWFVLVDKSTSSSGEFFLRQLETMSNVILVGTNSNGCLTTGFTLRMSPIYLPNSKHQIIYGRSLMVANDMEGYDARGTLPDIYIANEDALDAVVRCYEHYKEDLISQD